MTGFREGRITPGGALFSTATRSHYAPSANNLNVSLDFNAAPSGSARGTEVIIPNNASPQVRAAAEAYNKAVVDFAAKHGISNYPNRGVRTREENGRGVPNTVHTEPFFNTDTALQQAVKNNPQAFAQLYQDAFGSLGGARIIAPHGVGADRGAVSDIFGTETDYGRMIVDTILGNPEAVRQASAAAPAQSPQAPAPQQVSAGMVSNDAFQQAVERAGGKTDEPKELTAREKMAGIGASLVALDQGSALSDSELQDILEAARKMPVFGKKKGISL